MSDENILGFVRQVHDHFDCRMNLSEDEESLLEQAKIILGID